MFVCPVLCDFYLEIMDIFSLEDEDNNGLFITQSGVNGLEAVNVTGGPITGDHADFQSPCVSLIGGRNSQYSDILDDDFEPFTLFTGVIPKIR